MTDESLAKISHPLTIFLLGATGDLAKKKIYKALYRLYQKRLLPATFTLIGNARAQHSREQYQAFVKGIIQPTNQVEWYSFEQNIYYVTGDIAEEQTFSDIVRLHQQLVTDLRCGNHMWLLATLPQLYVPVVHHLKQSQLYQTECGWTKVLLEKPFGTDLASSRKLNKLLLSVLREDQIYRIDHFLGKETVQNVVAFRFANGLFEQSWNHRHVDHIQVTFGETLGVEGRERFYDATGTIRDVVQNHLLQMIAVTLMEEPKTLQAEDIRHTRTALLEQIQPLSLHDCQTDVVLGQFTKGVIAGRSVLGYRENPQISKRSWTETAVAMKLHINNARWKGVPIYLRAGKRFATNVLEISIIFKDRQNLMFTHAAGTTGSNVLTFHFQPDEGMQLRLYVKKPGLGIELESVPFAFTYQNQFHMDLIEAYERLLYDASVGDTTLFPTAADVDTTWRIVDSVLKGKPKHKPQSYPAGSWGPEEFDELLQKDKRAWLS